MPSGQRTVTGISACGSSGGVHAQQLESREQGRLLVDWWVFHACGLPQRQRHVDPLFQPRSAARAEVHVSEHNPFRWYRVRGSSWGQGYWLARATHRGVLNQSFRDVFFSLRSSRRMS